MEVEDMRASLSLQKYKTVLSIADQYVSYLVEEDKSARKDNAAAAAAADRHPKQIVPASSSLPTGGANPEQQVGVPPYYRECFGRKYVSLAGEALDSRGPDPRYQAQVRPPAVVLLWR